MGSTNNLGSFTHDDYGTVNFCAFLIDGGRVSENEQTTLEELIANGVDGRRWRRKYDQYRIFRMDTLADGSSWTAGQNEANLYEALSGEFVTMKLTIRSETRTWKGVKIMPGVKVQLRPGAVIGGSADPASAYALYGSWELVLTRAAS